MTYNVGNGLADPLQLVDLIERSGVDVVGLQELESAQAETLSTHLARAFPYQVLIPSGFNGKALLSRFAIRSHEQLTLHPVRTDLRAVVDMSGVDVQVMVAHPPPPRLSGLRMRLDRWAVDEIEQLAALTAEQSPSILLGDFNMTTRDPAYPTLRAAGLVDAFAVAGSGHGWTLPRRLGHSTRVQHGLQRLPLRPFMRVDYIWATSDFAPIAAWVGADAGSDHLPVLAQFDLRGN